MAGLQNAAGAGVATSRPHQALECFRTAAALGSPAAWFNCGVCFQEGQGSDVDVEKVRRGWHTVALFLVLDGLLLLSSQSLWHCALTCEKISIFLLVFDIIFFRKRKSYPRVFSMTCAHG